MRNGDGENADAAHALPGLWYFSTTAKWRAVRGEGLMRGRLGRTFTSAGVLDATRLTHSRRTISKWINSAGAAASGTKLSYSRQ